uniref:Acetyltransferase YpeA n=1 Tax=Candidatus Methanophagaceae archaeon ANME-1 ERB6 TaxID=2759912 RepID=A0A7G9YWA3_9EURY|nr:acetyltransferase YpeA [Methanosarcinales archaeon ANME-1 ERB6]
MILVRPSKESDEASVYDLITSLMEVSLDQKSFHDVFVQNLRDDTVLYYVVESDGCVVCFASIHICPQLHHAGLVGEIQELIVHESLRGKGIGAQLLSRLEQEAQNRGCVSIEVTTKKSRVKAQRFYEQMGFTRTHVNFTKNLNAICIDV